MYVARKIQEAQVSSPQTLEEKDRYQFKHLSEAIDIGKANVVKKVVETAVGTYNKFVITPEKPVVETFTKQSNVTNFPINASYFGENQIKPAKNLFPTEITKTTFDVA